MSKQVKRLEAFFKQKAISHKNDDGDDNPLRKYWKFLNLSGVEHWSIELNPMIRWTHFIYKFKNASLALPILYEESIKDVLSKKVEAYKFIVRP